MAEAALLVTHKFIRILDRKLQLRNHNVDADSVRGFPTSFAGSLHISIIAFVEKRILAMHISVSQTLTVLGSLGTVRGPPSW